MPSKKIVARETRKILVERFPLAFFPPSENKKPLKVGIFDDIMKVGIGVKPFALGFALADYCGGRSYHLAIMAGGQRVGIDGLAVGIVEPSHVANAISKYTKILEADKPATPVKPEPKIKRKRLSLPSKPRQQEARSEA